MVKTAEYQEYIDSESWRVRKTAYYRKHSKVCAACGSKDQIHLHHLTYDRFTRELDADLLPLCEICHVAVHKYARKFRWKSLMVATLEYVDHAKGAVTPTSTPPRRKRGKHQRRKDRQPIQPPPIKKRAAQLRKAGHKDPVNAAFAQVRERRRQQAINRVR